MALDKTTWWFSDENKAITLKPWLYNPYPEIENKNCFRKRRILSIWLKQQNLTLILIASLNLVQTLMLTKVHAETDDTITFQRG